MKRLVSKMSLLNKEMFKSSIKLSPVYSSVMTFGAKKKIEGTNSNTTKKSESKVKQEIGEPEVKATTKKAQSKLETEETEPKKKITKTKPAEAAADKTEDKSEASKKKKEKVVDNRLPFIKSPETIGKLPLDFPISISTFPKPLPNSADPYEGYINSNRISQETASIIKADRKYNCMNYAPVPIVLRQGKGAIVEDIDGFKYIDCLAGYSSVNFGHCNENIVKGYLQQLNKMSMTPRAFYNDQLYQGAKMLNKLFGKDKCVLMSTGVEAGETAVKYARRWGYRIKGIPSDQAKVVFAKGNFWGRTITAIGTSDDPSRSKDFGPYTKDAFYTVEYNNVQAIKDVLDSDPNICAVMLEPIQGEAGIIIPDLNYLPEVQKLCRERKVLLIVDEIQTGLGRTGKLLCSEYSMKEDRPDVILLAKSLTNGMYPVSAVLANKEIVDVVGPAEHGATFAGSPLGMATLCASLTELAKDDFAIVKNSFKQGGKLSCLLLHIKCPLIKQVRSKGLMIGLEFHHDIPIAVSDIVLILMERGILTKQTHSHCLRLTPPLTITDNEVVAIYHILKNVLESVAHQTGYVPQTGDIVKPDIAIGASEMEAAIKLIAENPTVTYTKSNPIQEQFKKQILSTNGIVVNFDDLNVADFAAINRKI